MIYLFVCQIIGTQIKDSSEKKIVFSMIRAALRAFRYSPGKKMLFRYGGQGASSGRSCPPASHTFFLPGAATSITAAGFRSLLEFPDLMLVACHSPVIIP